MTALVVCYVLIVQLYFTFLCVFYKIPLVTISLETNEFRFFFIAIENKLKIDIKLIIVPMQLKKCNKE